MLQKLDTIFEEFQQKLTETNTKADVLSLKANVIGKKGSLTEVLKSLKDATVEERKQIGPRSNQIKQDIEKLVVGKLQALEVDEVNAKLAKNKIDWSLTDSVLDKGLQGAGSASGSSDSKRN
jgi:phenylalanyl-tRNA synthetase alpha chain